MRRRIHAVPGGFSFHMRRYQVASASPMRRRIHAVPGGFSFPSACHMRRRIHAVPGGFSFPNRTKHLLL
jgi:hypothetical protein